MPARGPGAGGRERGRDRDLEVRLRVRRELQSRVLEDEAVGLHRDRLAAQERLHDPDVFLHGCPLERLFAEREATREPVTRERVRR